MKISSELSKLLRSSKETLESAGFTLKGAAASRETGVIWQGIAARANRNYEGRFQVILDTAIYDPFLDSPEHVVCLRGYLGRDGAGTKQVWWEREELALAQNALQQYAIPWQDQHANPELLARFFEVELQAAHEARRACGTVKAEGLTGSIVATLFPEGLPAPIPFVNHRWLSLLYFHLGRSQWELACHHLREYRKHVGQSAWERTDRQFMALKCAP